MEFKKSSRVLEKSLGKGAGKGDLAMLASRSNNGVVFFFLTIIKSQGRGKETVEDDSKDFILNHLSLRLISFKSDIKIGNY